jgi:hypothetical protein
MKKVTTFKLLSLLCFAMVSQLSFAQIFCLPQGGHVTLSEDFCDAEIKPGDALTPASNAAFGGAAVVTLFADQAMTQPLNNNIANTTVSSQNIGQSVYVVVTANGGAGQSCWTTIIPEDKTDPVIECPCGDVPVTQLAGELGVDSPTFDATGEVCWGFFADDSNEYVAYQISVDADDTYTFTINTPNPPVDAGDLFAAIYTGAFDADNPCDGQIDFDDDTNGLDPLVVSALMSAGDYTLVVAKTDFQNNALGTFTVDISSDNGGNVLAQDLSCVLSCTQVEDLLNGTIPGPVAMASDACGPLASFTKVDQFIDNDCGDDIVRRTYTAVDQSGNSATCTFDIIIDQPDASTDIAFPVSLDGLPGNLAPLQCDAVFATDGNGHPSPTVTGYPQIAGHDIVNGGTCDIAATYNDVVVPICEGTTKYYRTWTVVGWCPDFTGPVSELQIIKVVDDKGPTIAGIPSDVVEIGTVSTDCSGAYVYPPFVASDNCDAGPIAVSVSASAGTENAAGTAVFGLPLGLTTITVTATDDCGNTTTETYQVEVVDDTPPTMSCETFRTVSLTFDEPSLVNAIAFDDGSTDNCEIDTYEVRRMDNPNCPGFDGTLYADKAPFYCCDVGGPNVMVELKITDVAGNSNSCMVEVEVQDKLDPVITCPADKTVDCNEDPYAGFGEATAIDNCSAVITDFYSGSLNNCGEGTIFRFFTATDPGERTDDCFQTISVINSDPFCIVDTEPWTAANSSNPECQVVVNGGSFDGHTTNDDVEWPADITLDGCGLGLLPADLEANGAVNINNVRPRIFEDECDLVGMTYDDTELPITDGACRKVLRLWKVYDWCRFDEDNFDPNDPDTGFEYGYYEYVQIIKVIDNDGPVITSSCDDVSFCSYDPNCALGTATLLLSATDECTADGDLNYSYVIDAFNDGGNDIPGTGSDASGNYPIGTHKITWTVEDGCGNTSTCNYLFVISDCKAPTPNLLNGIATDLMENCQIQLWADDWDNPSSPSFDNCGIEEWVAYTPSLGPGQVAPPASASFGVTFTSVGTHTVDIWIKDVNGNWAYVSTYVLVQDNVAPFCLGQGSASIAGTIENEEATEVMDVMVNIDGDAAGIPDGQMTGATGDYAFPGLAVGQNYTVTPEKDGDYLNGVTTFDLVLMSKHILNVEPLNSPYKMIAADINKSGTITTFDMVELRKLILFIDTEFQNNTSWRFVDAEFVFPNASNPFTTSFPEIFNVNDLQGEEIGDFVAVKVGDVNCSAQVNPFAGSGDDRSANGELVFGVQDEAIVAGETYTVDFTAADFAEVLGYQFTLAFDNNTLEFVDVETSLEGLTEGNFGMSMLNEGIITTSWNTTNAVSLDADAKVFSLTFVAKSNAQLSEVLAVNSRYTKAEGYDNDVNLLEIGLSFNGATSVSGAFELYQNQPNPFKDETTIGFNMPEAGFASLTIYDVSGKLLHRVEGEYAQGFNQVSLNRSDLAATGVVYYQLDTENDSATKKMILIK